MHASPPDPFSEFVRRGRADRCAVLAELIADGLVGSYELVRDFFFAPSVRGRDPLRIAAP